MNLEKAKASKTYKDILALSHEQAALLATCLLSASYVAIEARNATSQTMSLPTVENSRIDKEWSFKLVDSLTTLQEVIRSTDLIVDNRELCS